MSQRDPQAREVRDELPEGHEQISALVRETDRLGHVVSKHELVVADKKLYLRKAEEALRKAQTEHAGALARLRTLIALGKCGPENGCSHNHETSVTNTAADTDDTGNGHFRWLKDESLPVVWRVGFMLADNPVLDYFGTALRLYGPTSHRTAKNRVNGHITQLRKHGVVDTLGNNRFHVNRARLAEKSGRPVPEGAPMT